MATKTIKLKYDNDGIIIQLPNGQEVEVWWSYMEPGLQVPQLEIVLPEILAVNCWQDNMAMAPALQGMQHARLSKELHICIEHGYDVDD